MYINLKLIENQKKFEKIAQFDNSIKWKSFQWIWIKWHHGVAVITTAQLHSIKPELRFCAGSNPAHNVLEIHYGEDLWQWSRLEMRLNPFHQSTILQKQFIIIHHWFAKSVANSKYISLTWIYCCKISTSSSFGSVWLNNFLVQFLHICWPGNIS